MKGSTCPMRGTPPTCLPHVSCYDKDKEDSVVSSGCPTGLFMEQGPGDRRSASPRPYLHTSCGVVEYVVPLVDNVRVPQLKYCWWGVITLKPSPGNNQKKVTDQNDVCPSEWTGLPLYSGNASWARAPSYVLPILMGPLFLTSGQDHLESQVHKPTSLGTCSLTSRLPGSADTSCPFFALAFHPRAFSQG